MRNSNNVFDPAATQGTVVAEKRGNKRAMHPCNKYAEKPPDFSMLASRYPSFGEFVTYGPNKKPRIDWTDFNATRELTRVLLEHDYGIKWWIPDGQLCPTVPNRANYIHWIEDLLCVSPAPWHTEEPSQIRGIDIGTGANCIYPLLGATLNGWHFVATDVTGIALEWAQRNLHDNPQLLGAVEVRRAGMRAEDLKIGFGQEKEIDVTSSSCLINNDHSLGEIPVLESKENRPVDEGVFPVRLGRDELPAAVDEEHSDPNKAPFPQNERDHETREKGPLSLNDDLDPTPGNAPVLVGVIKENERFDFCMCNPPFFENIEEAGLNPRTACGGTQHEMVYPGGELAFITKIVQDSLQLRSQIQWYTSLVGRKVNIKLLTATLRARGVTMLRTTEFVQGWTSRWGIAWSFSPVQKQVASIPGRVLGKSNVSFMLEGVGRKCSAWDIMQALADQLRLCGATITVDTASFSLTGTVSSEACDLHPVNSMSSRTKQEDEHILQVTSNDANTSRSTLSFRASVFQQVPGTLLIKASLLKAEGLSGTFSLLFEQVELALKKRFLKTAARG